MQTKTRVVVVMPRERWTQILGELDSLDITASAAETCQEARRLLERGSRVDLVISDLSLADGNWCNVFKHLIDSGVHASMVVIAREADERLWSEVLWRGAYDLLVEPYATSDVRRVVEGAVRAASDSPALLAQAGSVATLSSESVAVASH